MSHSTLFISTKRWLCFNLLGNVINHMEYKNIIGSPPSIVLLAYDATKDHNKHELTLTINGIRMRGDILRSGDKIVVLGVLQNFRHPMGYHMEASIDSLFGTNARAIEEEVSKKTDMFKRMLRQSADLSRDEKVSIEVKIIAGMPIKKIVLQEAISCKAAWVILDRQLRKDLNFYLKETPCKVALVQDSLSIEVLKLYTTINTDVSERKFSYSVHKHVEVPVTQENGNDGQSLVSFGSTYSYEDSDISKKGSSSASSEISEYSFNDSAFSGNLASSGAPVLCSGCGMKTAMYVKESMRFKLADIEAATFNFSKEKLLGEGGYGHVYKGSLPDGQVIAAKVRKEASAQGDKEFRSEVYVLSFARHRNIVMLLGYCSAENNNILVYEYICNKSLYWHLFNKSANVLEWHQRYAIAIGTAKGLRFLHEECRGCPIIHRDLRPSNILLTHDFIPMIGDFGLAKWKTGDDAIDTRVIGTLGYLAPEYVESGIVSVRTDVYAYGIVLLQLISGRKVIEDKVEGKQQFLLQWAEALIEKLALHELLDPRIGEADDDTYEIYNMARTAYMCVSRSPEMRPSMGEVVRLLEGKTVYNHDMAELFISHYKQ